MCVKYFVCGHQYMNRTRSEITNMSTKTVKICGLQTSRVRIIDKHRQSLLLNLANIKQTKGIFFPTQTKRAAKKNWYVLIHEQKLQSDTEMKFVPYLFPLSVWGQRGWILTAKMEHRIYPKEGCFTTCNSTIWSLCQMCKRTLNIIFHPDKSNIYVVTSAVPLSLFLLAGCCCKYLV